MDSKTYQNLAEKTLSGKFYASNDATLQNLLHASIGLVTEAVELVDGVKNVDIVNIGEEIGDLLWYVSIFERELDYNYDKIKAEAVLVYDKYRHECEYDIYHKDVTSMLFGTSNTILKESSYLLDYLKKSVFYGRPVLKLVTQMIDKLDIITFNICLSLLVSGKTVEESRRLNIAKLSARYPDGFSEYFAQNRDLESELRILSQKD